MENEEREQSLPVIADDFLIQVAEQAEKRIDAVIKIKKVALKVTNARDWTDQQGNPYLMASGSEKIANLFNISWRIDEPIFDQDSDGHYTYTFKGYFSLGGGRTIEAEGSRSSRDNFFVQYKYKDEKGNQLPQRHEIPITERSNKRDVKMAALTNLLGNGITRILGIRNLTWEDLKEFAGITKEQVTSIQYKKHGEPIQEPQKKNGDKPPTDAHIVTTTIKEVTMTSGKKKDGSDWTLYVVHTEDGEKYSTFSKSMAEAAKKLSAKKSQCDIIYEATEKGKNLKEIVEHIEDGNAQE